MGTDIHMVAQKLVSRRQTADAVMQAYPRHTFVNIDDRDYYDEFVNSKCEMCDALPGARFMVHAVIIGEKNNEEERIEFEVCGDCRYYIEYGEGTPEYFEGEE